jgi:hypothetical protein
LQKKKKGGPLISLLELLTKHNDNDDAQEHSTRTLFSIATRLTDIIATDEKTMARHHGTTVASIILLRHLPDLYAALLQLAYQPVRTTTLPQSQEHHKSPATLGLASNAATPLDKALGPDEKTKCARMFMWLFER